jgi:Bacterial DNA-binding protein
MPPSTPKSSAAKAVRPAKAEKPAKTVAARTGGAKSAAKPTDSRSAVALSVEKAATAPKVRASGAPASIKLRNLVDSVAAATGAKKPDAKKSVEAVLAAISAGLAAKSPFVLPTLGKLRVVKSNGNVLTLKLRQPDSSRAQGLALADEDEES